MTYLLFIAIAGSALLAMVSGLWVAWGLFLELKGPGRGHKK